MILFAEQIQTARLEKLGNPLLKLSCIDWEIFRPALEDAVKRSRPQRKSNAGRLAYDVVFMLKILVLQRFYNLSDDQIEYQINDRLSFSNFLGISFGDKVPDAKTVWLFREHLKNAGVIDDIFALLLSSLANMGLIMREGVMVDATFVEAPRQRNSREENKQIKDGEVPEEWQADTPEARHKKAQKDVDARWTIKASQRFYGYKNHVKADVASKLVTDCDVTPANVHDSQRCLEFIEDGDVALYADSAYSGSAIVDNLPEGVANMICEKGCRNKPLTAEQKASNVEKSRVRCRIEHIFGFMTMSMHGLTVRTIGLARARFNIVLTNFVYDIFRAAFLLNRGLVRPI